MSILRSKPKIQWLLGGVALGVIITLALLLSSPNTPPLNKAYAQKEEESPEIETAISLQNAFVDVVKEVGPAVVNIHTERTVKTDSFEKFFDRFKDTPFEEFFRGMPFESMPEEYTQRSLGSGMIVDERGYILTNNHVVAGTKRITVRLIDGREFEAEVVGQDPKTDLAVVKISDSEDLPVITFGDSDTIPVGAWVVAIGNPFGFDHTVTVGVISGKGRYGFGAAEYENFLQTDASINPGNSGGPLIDIEGRVVGISTLIVGLGTGLGFAIPSNMAREIVDQLIEYGKVTRAWLGVYIQDFDEELAGQFNLEGVEGVLVSDVIKGSPAEEARLKVKDIILEVDGEKVTTARELQEKIISKRVGQRVDLKIIRDSEEIIVKVTLGEMPEEEGTEAMIPSESEPVQRELLGITVQNITSDIAEELNITDTEGVIISDVDMGSPAYDAGLKRGDIIREVRNQKIGDIKDFQKGLSGVKAGDTVLLLVEREGRSFFATIKTAE